MATGAADFPTPAVVETTAAYPTLVHRASRSRRHERRKVRRRFYEANRSCIECDLAGRACSHFKPPPWGSGPLTRSLLGTSSDRVSLVEIPSDIHSKTSQDQVNIDVVPANAATTAVEARLIDATSLQLQRKEGVMPDGQARSLSRGPSFMALSRRSPTPNLPSGQIPRNPDILSRLAPNCRLLLDYFAHKVTRAFSLHKEVQTRFCTTYIPMALHAPTGYNLLADMLSLSAIHRKLAGLNQSDDLIAFLRYQSVRRLQLPLVGESREADDIAMATTLMLCLSEIMSGGEKPNSWRLHLQGAAAIQRGMDEADKNNPNAVETPNRSFLRRWSVALEVLALLCGAPMSESDVQFVLHVAKPDGGEHYIDEFHGFTTKLVPVFGEINLMSIELNSSKTDGQGPIPSERAASPELRKR